jgi:Arc/MetJ-type ribon-helix-helix transcriptional regulator
VPSRYRDEHKGAESKKEGRLQVVLGPATLIEIDDYRFTARLGSKSDAIRRLIRFALKKKLPQEHLDTLKQMRKISRTALLKTSHDKPKRIHIALEPDDLRTIDDYRDAAHHGSRAETVRVLLGCSLEGKSSKAHLDIIDYYTAPKRRIRQRARVIWEREGRPADKATEHWRQAEAEIAAEENAVTKQRSGLPERAAAADYDVVHGLAPASREWISPGSVGDVSEASAADERESPRPASSGRLTRT